AEMELDEPRRAAQEEREDAAGERVEGAAVADPSGRGKTTDEGDDVVRCWTDRLGDDEDPVEATRPARTAHPVSDRRLRRAGAPRRSRPPPPPAAGGRSWPRRRGRAHRRRSDR